MKDSKAPARELSARSYRRLRYSLYLILILLINAAGATLFFRLDLTANRIHSLSNSSTEVLQGLEEPLTVRVFLSENLPQPYNSLERDIRNLLESFRLEEDRYFSYAVYRISDNPDDPETLRHREMAEDYGISPVQIQDINRDEVKLVNAWMGLVIVFGDRQFLLPVIDPESNLEYLLTTGIRKLTQQTGKLLSLEENIRVSLVLSSSLSRLGSGLSSYPRQLAQIVEDLNGRFYNRLEFSLIDPDRGDPLPADTALSPLQLKDTEGEGHIVRAGLVMEGNGRIIETDLMSRGARGYQLLSTDELRNLIEGGIPDLLETRTAVGYLTDHGALPLYTTPFGDPNRPGLDNFAGLVSENYDIRPVYLSSEEPVPQDLATLIIAGPVEPFTERELFRLDQFVMNGGSLAVFYDTHREILPTQEQMWSGQMPVYIPLETGLTDLLKHYGAELEKGYVLDTNCFSQVTRESDGGLTETPLYYIPEIGREEINGKSPAMNNLKGLLAVNISPLDLPEAPGETGGAEYSVLFSSTPDAWLMEENINLYNPLAIQPPPPEERRSFPLAVLRSGPLTSYFDARPLPPAAGEPESPESQIRGTELSGAPQIRRETADGKVFLTGSSAFLQNSLVDQRGVTPNAMMVLNMIDTLSGRPGDAEMRSKGQSYNPLREVSPAARSFIKGFNTIGLPLLAVLAGLTAWFIRRNRQKKIYRMFSGEGEER